MTGQLLDQVVAAAGLAVHGAAAVDAADAASTRDALVREGNSVGALVVQNEWDSQTPSFSGIGLHKALPGSRLVFVDEGEGHGVYKRAGNKCAYTAVNAYLADGVLPAGNVTCTADTATSNSSLRPSDRFPTTRPDRF